MIEQQPKNPTFENMLADKKDAERKIAQACEEAIKELSEKYGVPDSAICLKVETSYFVQSSLSDDYKDTIRQTEYQLIISI